MEKLIYRLPVFEGPLDALLYLIGKNKLNIYDIPIAELLDQYLGYLHSLRQLDLEVESDFLDMASKLVQIKSAMLLPRQEDAPEEDPRSELVAELIGYQTCKAMAQALRDHADGFDRMTRAPESLPRDDTYRCTHEVSALRDAWIGMGDRARRRLPPPASAFREIVAGKVVSVMARIVHVVRRLLRFGESPLTRVFDDSSSRSEAVATFLAVLELIRSKKMVVEPHAGEDYVRLTKTRKPEG